MKTNKNKNDNLLTTNYVPLMYFPLNCKPVINFMMQNEHEHDFVSNKRNMELTENIKIT